MPYGEDTGGFISIYLPLPSFKKQQQPILAFKMTPGSSAITYYFDHFFQGGNACLILECRSKIRNSVNRRDFPLDWSRWSKIKDCCSKTGCWWPGIYSCSKTGCWLPGISSSINHIKGGHETHFILCLGLYNSQIKSLEKKTFQHFYTIPHTKKDHVILKVIETSRYLIMGIFISKTGISHIWYISLRQEKTLVFQACVSYMIYSWSLKF